MKNLTVYIGKTKKCLDIKKFEKDGEYTFIPDFEIGSWNSILQMGQSIKNVKTINEQAILIQNQYGHFYNYKINNSLIDNLKIVLDNSRDIIRSIPSKDNEIFYDKESLVPYYSEQPKKLSFRKLKKDLLMDPRIEH